MNTNFKFLLPFLTVLVLIIGVAIGMQLAPMSDSKPPVFASTDESRLEEILQYINYNYVDTVNTEKLMDDLVSEYLDNDEVITDIFKRLDPHSSFIPASALRSETESLQGNFEGIGIEFNILKDTILVVSPISGGPSEKLGILSGDKIIEVEDSLVAGVGVSETDVRNMLRGEKGTKVKVSIFRQGEPDLISFNITRDKIPLYSMDVAYMVDDKIGYLSLNRFSATTVKEFRKGLSDLLSQGMEKLVLDLRGNPGGYLMAATEIADEFLSGRKMIVYTEGKSSRLDEYNSGQPGRFEKGDMVILIDEGSASASEIVAGALQDHTRATIVGRRSFGKGLVQEIYQVGDSSAIRLTVARYYTPDGRCIQRSYEDGVDAYYEDYMERVSNGGEVSDSVKAKAQEGYGIIPDVIVPADTSADRRAFNRLYNSGQIQRFVYDYHARNRAQFAQYNSVKEFLDGYEVPEQMMNQLLSGLQNKPAADVLERIRPKIKDGLSAQLARQIYGNEGFFPYFHRFDPEFQEAVEILQKERSLDPDLF